MARTIRNKGHDEWVNEWLESLDLKDRMNK